MRKLMCALIVLTILLQPLLLRAEEFEWSGWSATIYGGTMADESKGGLADILTGAEYSRKNNMLMGALSREIYHYKRLGFEAEGQFGKHWGDSDYYETVGAMYVRLHMPFEEYIRISTAFGAGLSYTSDISAAEYRKDPRVSKLLGYLSGEITLGLPAFPKWDLIFRLHHRSGAKGIIGHCESNYICAGVKINF